MRYVIPASVLGLLFVQTGCKKLEFETISGNTMGTHYQLQYLPSHSISQKALQNEIENQLEDIDKDFSNWRTDSWISKFNQLTSEEQVALPKSVKSVLDIYFRIAEKTDGSLDPTLSPLIELWGFGSTENKNQAPAKQEILASIQNTGLKHLYVDQQNNLIWKSISTLQINLSAVVKGYAVDQLSELMKSNKIKNYCIDIGGEVKVSGTNSAKQPWSIGIARPISNLSKPQMATTLSLTEHAVATSGISQNFRKIDGTHYSHLIDPKTGYPVNNTTISASILAPSCALADALATTCMILDDEGALELIDSFANTEAFLLIRNEHGDIIHKITSGWPTK